MAQAEQTDERQPTKWADVSWAATQGVVQRIQDRIFRAAKAGNGVQVKNLQKLLARSRSAKLLAIRQVTQQNAGKYTPGVDGVVCETPDDRVALLESGLDFKGYKPKPVRLAHLQKIKAYLDANKQRTAGQLVRDLAPIIRGWTGYYRSVCSGLTFTYADHRLWRMLWQWAQRRHPKKGKRWVKERYFKRNKTRDWNFGDVGHREEAAVLPWYSDTKIVRHTKVRGRVSPLDPDAKAYWADRRRERLMQQVYTKKRQGLLWAQGFKCAKCGVAFDPDEDIRMMDVHHQKHRKDDGGDEKENLQLLHRWCHHKHHQQVGYKAAKA